ncbi:MAG: monooxygenase, partial [Pseudomonadota bacterium]
MAITAAEKDRIRQRYEDERDKRLRADGNAQYTRLEDRFEALAVDPYTPVAAREPVTDHVTFAF